MTPDPSIQQRLSAFWNLVAPEYEAHPGNVAAPGSAAFEAWMDAIRRALPDEPGDVLDVGTGTGFVALIAAALGHRVTGIDLAEEMLAIARRHAAQRRLEARFLVGDAVRPGVPPASLDAVVSRNVIWTLPQPHAAARHWHRALRRGGRVAVFASFAERAAESDRDRPGPGERGARPPRGDTRSAYDRHFDRYYTAEVQAALPMLGPADPIADALERAGFAGVALERLMRVEAADPLAGPDPLYCITAYRR